MIAVGSPGVAFAGVSVSTIEDVNLRLSLRIDTELFDALTLCHTIVTGERTAPFGADRLTIDLVDTESAEQLNAHDYLAELRLNIDDSAGWSTLALTGCASFFPDHAEALENSVTRQAILVAGRPPSPTSDSRLSPITTSS